MCFFGGGGGGSAPGPQSTADRMQGGYTPPVNKVVNRAVQNQNTADRNTMRRADSYGSRNKSSTKVTSALNSYSNAQTNKTILGS